MADWAEHFRGKKVTVMGLGLLGRGVGDAEFLANHGADLIVTDLKTEEELADSLARLKKFPNITYRLGGHNVADFKDRDFVLKAAGVPLKNMYIDEARKNNIPIKMSASWFAELAGIPTVGVTGTRGKTTVTLMLYEIMKASGMEVLLGGNIRGVSTLALLDSVTQNSIGLFELDSWQCQGWGESKMSPNIAVFTTFLDDHLNYYQNDRDAYLGDKAQIFLNQTPDDSLVVSTQVAGILEEKYKNKIRSRVVLADARDLPKSWALRIPGEHNRLNAACALLASRALGIDDEVSQAAITAFKGVPGRLQLVREVNGIKIYNDTTATTPDATLAALDALGTNTVLIMGGADKGLDMSALSARLGGLKKVVRIEQGLRPALDEALASARAGDNILFSPAYASFGMFKNEYDRGDQFDALVAAIPELDELNPKVKEFAETLIVECKKEGFDIVISRGYRSIEKQNEYYAQGRTTPGKIITNAVGGSSYHNYGLAFDIRPVVPDDQKEEYYKKAGVIGERLGLEWGGRWTEFLDPPHFQFTGGLSIDDCKSGKTL